MTQIIADTKEHGKNVSLVTTSSTSPALVFLHWYFFKNPQCSRSKTSSIPHLLRESTPATFDPLRGRGVAAVRAPDAPGVDWGGPTDRLVPAESLRLGAVLFSRFDLIGWFSLFISVSNLAGGNNRPGVRGEARRIVCCRLSQWAEKPLQSYKRGYFVWELPIDSNTVALLCLCVYRLGRTFCTASRWFKYSNNTHGCCTSY